MQNKKTPPQFPLNFTEEEIYDLIRNVIPEGVDLKTVLKGVLMMAGEVRARFLESSDAAIKGMFDCYTSIARQNLERQNSERLE